MVIYTASILDNYTEPTFSSKRHWVLRRPPKFRIFGETVKKNFSALMRRTRHPKLAPSLRQWLTGTRLVKLRTECLLHHNHLGIRALAYPEVVKGVQPTLNVFNCFCTKILSKLCSCVHYMLNFVQENVTNCTRTLISHFASEFSSFCFVPRPLARSPFRKFQIHHHYKIWVRLCYGSVSKCFMSAVVSPWTPLGS